MVWFIMVTTICGHFRIFGTKFWLKLNWGHQFEGNLVSKLGNINCKHIINWKLLTRDTKFEVVNPASNPLISNHLKWNLDWFAKLIGLYRCWWRMLETNCVGDRIWMLVTSHVTNIKYQSPTSHSGILGCWWPIGLSPTCRKYHQHTFLSPTS